MSVRRLFLMAFGAAAFGPLAAAADPPAVPVEELPTDPKLAKVVFVAGSTYFKPGEHEYAAGCAVLMDLVRQTPGVFPVYAVDWPKKPETFAGAKAVVFFMDGGDKHPFLKDNRLAEVQKLMDAGVGLVQFHQIADYPKDLGDRVRGWAGAAWEKGYSERAHWVAKFDKFPDHPVSRGVTAFEVDDGWLTKLRFTPDMKGVTPLVKTTNPKAKTKPTETEPVVGWAFDRPGGGRSFTFTGGHLHVSFGQPGYRKLLVNGILWAAGLDVPAVGFPVALTDANRDKYLAPAPKKK